MSSSTLTSLAILKVNIDQGKDYLDYLKPFILDILSNLSSEDQNNINDDMIHKELLEKFGLNIPKRSIQIVLKRISKRYPLRKKAGVYALTGNLGEIENISTQKVEAERHIQAIISGLIEFSKSTIKPVHTKKRAVNALLNFLSGFSIPCLKAYLRGTTIPTIDNSNKSDKVLVSKYVLHLQRTDPNRFKSFMILVQGHMYANALTCPDLAQIPDTYKNVTFYLDTKLLIRLFGLDIKYKKNAIDNLIDLLRKLGGKVAVFSHLRDEFKGAIENAADNLENINNHSSIVREARHSGKTKSDLLLIAQQIDKKLSDLNILEVQTPKYARDFQIDEEVFDQVLEKKVEYRSEKTKLNDINSVRSIYVLRKGMFPDTVEKSKAILVSHNTGFAQAAYSYGQRYEEFRKVSSVITDFSLANMAWLKAPMGAVNLPKIEVLAFSYAALRPSKKLLNKYLQEIERLEKNGKIQERDHQLLRSYLIEDDLVNLTMGDEDALSEETITEMKNRIREEMTKEETKKTQEEKRKHEETNKKLIEEQNRREKAESRLYWICNKRANIWSWILYSLIIIVQIIIIFSGMWFKLSNIVTGIFSIIIVGLNAFDLASWKMRERIEKALFKYFFKEKS